MTRELRQQYSRIRKLLDEIKKLNVEAKRMARIKDEDLENKPADVVGIFDSTELVNRRNDIRVAKERAEKNRKLIRSLGLNKKGPKK